MRAWEATDFLDRLEMTVLQSSIFRTALRQLMSNMLE